MRRNQIAAVLLALFISVLAADSAAAAQPADTVDVPFTAHGHAVDSGKGDGRSYYYIVLDEQMCEVRELEVTFTHEGVHRVWAIRKDGKAIKVGNGALKKGTHRIKVAEDMARLEFDLFTDEIPSLGLNVPGGMTAPNTPYAGRYLAVLGDSLSAAYDWKSTGDDPDALRVTSQWWFAVAKEFGMNLLINSSMSSSGIYIETDAGGDSGLQRCTSLHTADREPDYIFVMLGANDIMRGRTSRELADGYREMVRAMQGRYPKANIVMFAYPHFGAADQYDLYSRYVDTLRTEIKSAAADCGVSFVDLSGCPFTAGNMAQYLRSPEDIHFNRAGQALVGQQAIKGLYALAAQLSTAKAMPTNDKLTCDGQVQNATVYKIGGSNYFQIRDLAAMLNGTGKQFSVGYDGASKTVTATSGQPYQATGKELAGALSGGERTAQASNDAIYINGEKSRVDVYKIDGGNYFKLRDLGEALNFYVGWEAGRGVCIETDRPYSK